MRELIRYATFEDYEAVIKKLIISEPLGEILIEHKRVCPDSDRYRNFYHNGYKCTKCGLEVSFAALERAQGSYLCHINLYGIKDGKEILFTKDHIYPRSKGGLNTLANYQVMCENCNSNKKDKTEISQEEAIERGLASAEAIEALTIWQNEREKYEKLKQEMQEQEQIMLAAKAAYRKLVPERIKDYTIMKKVKFKKGVVKNENKKRKKGKSRGKKNKQRIKNLSLSRI